ncbi:MAG: short-chain fatty acid transporter [Polyangia bacterium]
MIRALGSVFSKVARRWLPDAFIFAIVLAIIVFILGIAVEGATFTEMTGYFGDGMWSLLAFSMQMVLILVTGMALATSKPVHRVMKLIASSARTPGQGIVIATIVMIAGCWLNWGFGLIVSALVAKEIARSVKGLHYPLLVASAYSGFVVWHAGLSGSIPLKIAGQDSIMTRFADGEVVPTSQTVFGWENLTLVGVFLVTIPIVNRLMMPKKKSEIIEVDPASLQERTDEEDDRKQTPARRLEDSRLLSYMIGLVGIVYVLIYFHESGSLSLNIVIFIFLFAGIILHGTPIRYVRAVDDAICTCGGIALQFPFYAGIMGMMVDSGLASTLSRGFVGISSETTLPFFSFLSAGIVNFFVPSGGGQWVVQGPIMMPAAAQLGTGYSTVAMAIAWGDAWTNMIQPFWALPLLAVAKLNIRDIMGYTTVVLLFTGIVISTAMLTVF